MRHEQGYDTDRNAEDFAAMMGQGPEPGPGPPPAPAHRIVYDEPEPLVAQPLEETPLGHALKLALARLNSRW